MKTKPRRKRVLAAVMGVRLYADQRRQLQRLARVQDRHYTEVLRLLLDQALASTPEEARR